MQKEDKFSFLEQVYILELHDYLCLTYYANIFCVLGCWNPLEVSMDDIFRCNYLHLEEMTSLPETQINGITAVVDFQGFSFRQVRYFTPKHALRMVKIIQVNINDYINNYKG